MRITFKCKSITPMFMAGADGRTPELRPSEFKGMMRWWWRAIKAEDDIGRLKKEEAEIFGGTGEGEGKSKVKITVRAEKVSYGDNVSGDIRGYEGLVYLYYSTFLLKAGGQQIMRSYLTPHSDFELSIFSFDKRSFLTACASLWLAIYLGGFGTRARRGGGNIEVTNIEISERDVNLNFICNAQNTSQLKNFLETNLTEIKSICGTNTNQTKPEYTNLKGVRILIFEPKNNWKEALNFLGKKYKEYRSNNKSQIFKTAAFGMPVMHSRFSVRMVPYGNKEERLSERWASPLIFKVIKSSNGLYFPLIVKLSGGGVNYIGREEKRNKRWNKNEVKEFTEHLLNDFLNNLLKEKKEELVL